VYGFYEKGEYLTISKLRNIMEEIVGLLISTPSI
jgi:hypothetical protein